MHVEVEYAPKRQAQKSKKSRNTLIISVAGFILCMAAGVFLLFSTPEPAAVTNTIPAEPLHYKASLSYDFGVLPSAHDQHIVKIEHLGGEVVENMSDQLWMSVYPPDSVPYAKRSLIHHTSKYLTFEPGDILYVYLGKDQQFYASKELPVYEDFIDFPDGKWEIHIDDARYKAAWSEYSFTVYDSKTHVVNRKSDKGINQLMNEAQPYDTLIIVGDQIYHEQVLMEGKTVRLLGTGGPIIDAGGIGSAITIANCSYGEVSGFDIRSSGTGTIHDSGIYLKNSDHIFLRNNSLHDNQYGIYLASSFENDIRYNYVQLNDIAGISIGYGSSKNTIKNNYVALNTIGIYIRDTSDNNYVVLNTGGGNTRYGILIESKLNNMYEYNNMSNDRMSYDKIVEDKITYYSEDKGNTSDWLSPDRKIGLHESVL